MQSKCVRQKAPGELLEIFRLLPVKVDELDMGIIKANDHYVDDVELLIDSPCTEELIIWASEATKFRQSKRQQRVELHGDA